MKLLTQWAVTSSVLILIVLAVRYLFRDKLSARLRYALWGVVLLRLLVPLQVELSAAPLPVLASNLAPELGEERSIPVFPGDSRPVSEFDFAIEDLLEPGELMPTETSMGYYQRSEDGETITQYLDLWSPAQIAGALWGTGAVLMALVLAASNLHFCARLKKRRKPLECPDAPIPVYVVEGLPSPCLFGLFRPAVYLNPGAEEQPDALRHILAHELTHYAHRDHIWSLLRVLALALHWYNPLVWLAVVLSKRDGELACDEGAVAQLGEAERVPYGRTLVDMVAARSLGPAGLLSCSTAMTGGRKSIQQRIARLIKKPETVKAALFAAVALVALSAVFVFAGRGDANLTEVDAFLSQLEGAQAVFVGQPAISSAMPPGLIDNPEPLSRAKELLSRTSPVARGEGTWTVLSLSSDHPSQPITQEELETMFFLGGHPFNLYPTASRDLETAHSYWLLQGEDCCLLAQWYPEREENTVEALAALPVDTLSRLKGLTGQYVPPGVSFPELDSFPDDVASAQAIRLRPNYGEDYRYPDITAEDLLEQARDRLSLLEPPADDPPAPALNALAESWQLTLISNGEERTYTLLAWNDYTCLVRGDAPEEYQNLAEGQTMELGPFWRTPLRTSILGSLNGLAAQQFSRQDEDQAVSYFNGNFYQTILSRARAIYHSMPMVSQEKAITDLNLLLHAKELLALERLPQDEPVIWDGEGWTYTLTISFRGPTQERGEESEQLYYVVPTDGDRSYICTGANQEGGVYLGTVSNENLEELERLFQDQEKLDGILLGALEDCAVIRFEDSKDPDITAPAALERAKTILTSGLLIDDLNHAGENGDNEHITIRSASGLKESTFLVTNPSIREALHSLARDPSKLSLTQGELNMANQAFQTNVEVSPGEFGFSEISCFFTSSYDDPTQIDLEEFLRYCPLAEIVENDEVEEFQAVMEKDGGWESWEYGLDSPGDLPVPTWRYPREKVSALLQKYAGVTVDQLDWGDMLYVEEYDAFYNFTSDAGPGFFTCTGGQMEGDTVLLWSDPVQNGDRSELTLKKSGDRWLIRSFHTAYPR